MEFETRGLVQGGPEDARVEEWHDPEPAGDDQPEPAGIVDPETDRPGGTPEGITAGQTEQRARFASYLRRSLFPADRAKLRAAAEAARAPDEVLEVVDRLPDGEFPNVAEAWAAAGGGLESHRW
jgi:hypothetical protein